MSSYSSSLSRNILISLLIVFIRNSKNANEINGPKIKSHRLLVSRLAQVIVHGVGFRRRYGKAGRGASGATGCGRSSVTVRGSDCDAGAPSMIPRNVSKPAVTKFRSIVATRQPTSRRRAPDNIDPSEQNQNATNHDRGNTWRGVGKPRYRLVLFPMRGLNSRSGRPRRM